MPALAVVLERKLESERLPALGCDELFGTTIGTADVI
jgi:hypothetical protein